MQLVSPPLLRVAMDKGSGLLRSKTSVHPKAEPQGPQASLPSPFHGAAIPRRSVERLVNIRGFGAIYCDRGGLCTSVTLGIQVVSID